MFTKSIVRLSTPKKLLVQMVSMIPQNIVSLSRLYILLVPMVSFHVETTDASSFYNIVRLMLLLGNTAHISTVQF